MLNLTKLLVLFIFFYIILNLHMMKNRFYINTANIWVMDTDEKPKISIISSVVRTKNKERSCLLKKV